MQPVACSGKPPTAALQQAASAKAASDAAAARALDWCTSHSEKTFETSRADAACSSSLPAATQAKSTNDMIELRACSSPQQR
jgi:hypothetical protein